MLPSYHAPDDPVTVSRPLSVLNLSRSLEEPAVYRGVRFWLVRPSGQLEDTSWTANGDTVNEDDYNEGMMIKHPKEAPIMNDWSPSIAAAAASSSYEDYLNRMKIEELKAEIGRIKEWQRWAWEHPFSTEAIQYGDMADQQLNDLENELQELD